MRAICTIFLLLASSITYGTTSRSSVIPERREFPIRENLNPCDNFYEHVCRGVIDSFKLREDRSHHTFSFSDSAERILEKKKDYFKNLSKIKPESKREESLKNYYLACMDEKSKASQESREKTRIQTLTKAWKNKEDTAKWLEDSYLSAENSPLDWGPISNFDTPLKSDLYLTTGYMTLPEKSYYKKKDVMSDFQKVATSFFKAIGSKNPKQQAQHVLDFEAKLAEVTPEPEQFRQIINNRTFITRADLLKKFPHLKVEKLVAEIPADVVIRDWVSEAMTVADQFFANADLEAIRSVIQFHSLYGLIDDSNPKFFNEKFNFEKKHLGGPNKRPDRQERCTRSTTRTFTQEIDSILIGRLFPDFDRAKFVGLAEKIRGAILKSLESNTWLSKAAKQEAILKMKKAKLYLVSPENEKEWNFLPQADYKVGDAIENSKIAARAGIQKNLRDLREPLDPGRWEMGPLTVNAYYDPSYNKFVMPIGILQYPFYDQKLSAEENLAAVGSVIGHELGHGVDDQGARYDSDGKQRQWMTMQDLAAFSTRTAFLIDQYNSAGNNGKLTLGENIGDLVGVTASYDSAMQEPGFAKDPERKKAFFRAYGRVWCDVERPKFTEMKLKVDSHALGVNRVNQPLKHMQAFQEAFKCENGSPMTLPNEKRVRIW